MAVWTTLRVRTRLPLTSKAYGCDGQRTSTVDRRPSTRSVVVGDAVAGRLRKYERGVRGCPINLLKPFDEFRGR
jgi:hypothetical protein